MDKAVWTVELSQHSLQFHCLKTTRFRCPHPVVQCYSCCELPRLGRREETRPHDWYRNHHRRNPLLGIFAGRIIFPLRPGVEEIWVGPAHPDTDCRPCTDSTDLQ